MAGENEKQSRIHWHADDIEAAPKPRPLGRSSSNVSINSGRRASIDPSSALPIQYRTV